jgi:glycosyltransferase involved in cell wall biosynthesis
MNQSTIHSKPKVLIFKSDLLPISETFIREQALHLKNWKPVLIAYSLVENGVDLTGLDILLLEDRYSLWSKIVHGLHLMLQVPISKEVYRLKKENAQLIHAHFGPGAVRVWPLAKALKLPMLVTFHGLDITVRKEWWQRGNGGFLMRTYPTRLLQLAREETVHFVAVSEAIKTRAIDYGIPPQKISVSYIGVDTQKFSPGSKPLAERREVLYVGRLVEKKGCIYLLEAFSRIQQQFMQYNLIIIGKGPLEKQLKRYTQINRVRAQFLGAQSSEQVKNKLKEARVVCLPSITAENGDAEGFNMVILEAQASGVPVVTSALGGAVEGIVHGVTGFAHAEKDVSGISVALGKLLSDDALSEKFGRAARKNILKRMDIRFCTRELENIYSAATVTY